MSRHRRAIVYDKFAKAGRCADSRNRGFARIYKYNLGPTYLAICEGKCSTLGSRCAGFYIHRSIKACIMQGETLTSADKIGAGNGWIFNKGSGGKGAIVQASGGSDYACFKKVAVCSEGFYLPVGIQIAICTPCPKPSCTSTEELVGTCSAQGYRCATKCKNGEYRLFKVEGDGACTTKPVCNSNEELRLLFGMPQCVTKCKEDEYRLMSIGSIGVCKTCGNLVCPPGTNRAPGTCGTLKPAFTCINADYDFCAATASPRRRLGDPVCEQSIHRWDTDNRCRQRPFWGTRQRPWCLYDRLFSLPCSPRLHRYCLRCIKKDMRPLQNSDRVESRGVDQRCHHPSRISQHNHMQEHSKTKAETPTV